MPTNKKYREKLQSSIKKVSDVVKDIELLTMTQSIPDSDREVFTSALDSQVRKIKQALRSEPLEMELEWKDSESEAKEDEKSHKPAGSFTPSNKDDKVGSLN